MRATRRHLNVRLGLTLWYAGVLAVALLAYAGGVFLYLRHNLLAQIDHGLREDVEAAQQHLAPAKAEGVRWVVADEDEEELEGPRWVDVWTASGRLVHHSAPAGWPALPTPAGLAQVRRRGSASMSIPGGIRVRELTESFSVRGVPVVIRVARLETQVDRQLGDFLLVLLLGVPVAVLGAGIGGYLLARRALAPVDRMAGQARRITADRLSERLPVVNPDDELGRLATVFNETLGRLERSFEELRRFTADASHELRTPLTALRSVGEVGLRTHRDPEEYRQIIGSMLEEAERLGGLVDSLLMLSRADAGQVPLRRADVDLGEAAREVAQQWSVLAEEKGQALTVEVSGPVPARVDRVVFRQALVNLVDNAIKHSPEGAAITVTAAVGPAGPTVAVSDTGPGIPEEHRDHIFDRFYRVDKGRSRQLGGTGLGLAIARWAVEAHGGRLTFAPRPGGGSTFRITLPPAGEEEPIR